MKIFGIAIALVLLGSVQVDAQCNNDYILLSTGTDFGSWVSTLDPITKAIAFEDTTTSLAMLRSSGSRAYALSGITGMVQILDPCDDFSTITSFYAGLEPRDLVMVSPTVGYVTRYDMDTVLKIDANGAATGTTDLGIFADADGLPEMDQMFAYAGRLYVCLQRVDHSTSAPTGLSYIVAINAATGTLIDLDPGSAGYEPIHLVNTKPISEINMRVHNGVAKMYFSAIGATGVLDGGVIECVAANPVQQSVILSEAAAGGDIYDVEIISDTKGFATIKSAPTTWELIAFNPSTGVKIGPSMFTAPQFEIFSDIEPSPLGLLLSYFNGPWPVGILCFDMNTNQEIPGGPITNGDYPWDILVHRDATTDANQAPVVTQLGQNYPNPFNPVTSIPFSLATGGRVTLRIYDVSGRQVATLLDEHRDAGRHVASWNGRTDSGAIAPTGVYFVRLEANEGIETKKIALLK